MSTGQSKTKTAMCRHCGATTEGYKGAWWVGKEFQCSDGEHNHDPLIMGTVMSISQGDCASLFLARTYRFYKEPRDGYTALIELVTDTVLQSQADMGAHIREEHRRARVAGHSVHVVHVSSEHRPIRHPDGYTISDGCDG